MADLLAGLGTLTFDQLDEVQAQAERLKAVAVAREYAGRPDMAPAATPEDDDTEFPPAD